MPADGRPTTRALFPPPTLAGYRASWLPADLIAGTIVAGMQIPQAMAYALLAGLPPQSGLYAAILPLVAYGLLGTCRTLAVGPVAIVALMVGHAVASRADPAGSAALLALLVAVALGALAVLRAGRLTRLLAPPVVQGFLLAAALLIGAGQTKHLLGVSFGATERPYEVFGEIATHVSAAHVPTLWIGGACLATLVLLRSAGEPLLARAGVPRRIARLASRAGPLYVALAAIAWSASTDAAARLGVAVIGAIPSGLPTLALPSTSWRDVGALLPAALVISLVIYVQSFSMAQGIAARRNEHVRPDRELVALGAANLGAALCGGFPVAGGLSRSAANEEAGARSGAATLVTATLVVLTLALGTSLLGYLPKAVLGAIILVAVLGLFDVRRALELARTSVRDGVALTVTFAGVLLLGIELGLLAGVLAHAGWGVATQRRASDST